MESANRQTLSVTESPSEAERPESPLTGLEFDMARLSLVAQNEELREKVNELKTELSDEKSHEQYLRREQLVEAKQIREEERKRVQAMVSDVRRKLYKEKQQEIHELKERLHKEKEKEITYIIKQKDEEMKKAQLSWNREKDEVVHKLRVQFSNEIREEAEKSHKKQVRKFEVYIEELKEQKKKAEESCKLAHDADKKKVNQIRRMHSEHEQELAKLKRSSWQEGRKQMAEIRQLTNIIHQLEKKLGVESGHYIRLQLEKDNLRDKLDRIKSSEMSGRRSPSPKTDLSSDLSMFSFPSMDDSNPLWLQLKQQKSAIAQLKQNVQDKNRRIDLLKQKLFKSRRFGGGMHRSMDDILSYDSAAERDECFSPVFGYSTGSSDTSSLNEESFQSDGSQDAEIIRRLQKEILQLQKAHSLLQAQTESTVDGKRAQMEKDQLQTDLIEAQRQIDELNKDLSESHDRNELLEFQLQESLQRNVDEGNCVSAFKIPTLCVDYQFADVELFCSAEEVKAKLEELQNEKKPVFTRDEQLTLQRAKHLLENIAEFKKHVPRALSFRKDDALSDVPQKDFLKLPVFDDSLHSDDFLDETDNNIQPSTDFEEEFLERNKLELDQERDVNEQELLEDVVTTGSSVNNVRGSTESVQLCDDEVQSYFNESSGEFSPSLDLGVNLYKGEQNVQLCDAEVQTDFQERSREFDLRSDTKETHHDVFVDKADIAIQCSTCCSVTETSSQCNILKLENCNEDLIVNFGDESSDICKFKKVRTSTDVGIQFAAIEDNSELGLVQQEDCKEHRSNHVGHNAVDSAVQCNIIEVFLKHEEKILEFYNGLETLRFKQVPVLTDNAIQTDIKENDEIFLDRAIEDDVMKNDVMLNDAMNYDVIGSDVNIDVICSDVTTDSQDVEVEEDEVLEKHDGEPSEKSLLGHEWKDFIDCSELGDDAKLLDCVVYEKEDVFIVICESDRKYCKEISSNDYTFDFDDDDDEVGETNSEKRRNITSNTIDSNDTFAVKLDCPVTSDSHDSEVPALQKLDLDRPKISSEIEKCEVGIQCENRNMTSTEQTCPHCLKPLSKNKNTVFATNEISPLLEGVNSSMLSVEFNEDEHVTEIVSDNEVDSNEEFRPQGIEFAFRETCELGVQCDLHNDHISSSSSDVPCLLCGYSKSSCRDSAVQCEIANDNDFIMSSSSDLQCVRCSLSEKSCCDVAIQCEFTDLLSASNGMLDGISEFHGVFQEDEGESLIKEVMALAKECSQNDVLIDQHLSEFVRGQGLFSETEDEENTNDEEDDQDEIILSNEQNNDLYSEIPNSQVFTENEQAILRDFGANSEDSGDVISEEGITTFLWKEVKDAETQCEENCLLIKEDKAIQCTILQDEQQLGIKTNRGDLAEEKRRDYKLEQEDGDTTEKRRELRSEAIRVLPQGSDSETSSIPHASTGPESKVIAENTVSDPSFSIDLDNVFDEMDAQPSNPVFTVTLSPQITTQATSDESTNVTRQHDDILRRPAVEEPTITRTSKADTLEVLDETFEVLETQGTGESTDRVSRSEHDRNFSGFLEDKLEREQTTHLNSSTEIGVSSSETRQRNQHSSKEGDFQHGESSVVSICSSEETSSSDGSSQVTVENNTQYSRGLLHIKPTSPPPPMNNQPLPSTEEAHPPLQNSKADTNSSCETSSFPDSDMPPPLPNTLPPTLPSASPPSVMHSDLDDEIEALLSGELDQDTGDLTPSEEENSVRVRSTLENEIQRILGSEDSSITSEANTVLSMDSLCMNQTTKISNAEPVSGLTADISAAYENTEVFNDGTEITSSYDESDVIYSGVTDDDDIKEGNDDLIFQTNDHLLYSSVEDSALDVYSKSDRKLRLNTNDSQRILETQSSPVKHVAFQSDVSEESATESSSVDEGSHRRQPPPVLPKPKYRSHSMNLPISELPSIPTQNTRASSMAAQRDIVDGYFPPVGLVTRRASEFNLGECDLLKERIVYLERQLKNKENLLQTMRAEAAEIETNAYIQKKEEDIKMMDESVRFLKVENQKKEKELVAKIGELNKCTFELEQLKSERSNAEIQRGILEDNVNSLQDQVSQLQVVQVQCQELRCKCDSLVKENSQLLEQVSRLHRADKEFVELEKTISKLQDKLKELEDVKRERDDVCEQLKALKTQKDDLAQKGRKVETERNDFLMNNKLIQQQKDNLEARNSALQRTNDTFKTKISSLEKECRDSQRKLFDIQRERDEGSSRLRKLEAERNELRKRVNESIESKSELKQYQSKSQDLERELNYLRTQCKKIESERTELSTELGNCLKERNRLVGRTAELEKLTRDNEKLEEKFHTLKLKIAELTGQRDDAEVQLPTLKAKVALLKNACKEKDEQLDKLKAEIRELKHSIASSALDDLSNVPSFGFGSPEKSVKFREPTDSNNNHITSEDSAKGKRFVVLFDYDPERLSTTGHPERELKLNEGDVITVNSDLDLNGYYMAEMDGKRGLVSSLYIEEMDEYDMRQLRKQREMKTSKCPAKNPERHSVSPRPLANLPGLVKRSFVALRDYNPFTSSTSSRPDLEIPLAAGEMVTVVGDVDANGYYTVEKGGRLAIVPSNLVKPSSPSLPRPNKLNFAVPVPTTEQGYSVRSQEHIQETPALNTLSNHYPSHSSAVPRQPSVPHVAPPGSTPYVPRDVTEQFLRQTSIENLINTQTTSTVGVSRGIAEGKTMGNSSGLPSAPRNLRVLRCVNRDALLLGWITPEVDELGRNNGQVIKGYKILANGQVKLEVKSPYMAKALIENLDLSRPVELAIQTIAEKGFCSEKSVTHFNEAVMMETTSVTSEDTSHFDENLPYRTFVALFSYDPLKSSPNPNPALELEFQEGDIIRVLDMSRPDGYFTGQVFTSAGGLAAGGGGEDPGNQVNGQEGLIPSNFIEEIAVSRPTRQRKRDKALQSGRSTNSPSPKKAKAMVALYDYNPATQSPNKQPGNELGFRKGQIIRVSAAMRSDGFYEAEINGQKGLVPATFLKPCKRKSTKSVNSTNGFASLPRRVQFAHEQHSRQMTAGYV